MPLVNNDWLKDVATKLEKQNPNVVHKYFYSQNFIKSTTGSPFESLIPKDPDFWGPRVLTLQVISRDYVWTEPYLSTELQRFKRFYSNWEEFKVYFWIDYTLAQRVDETNGDSVMVDKMNLFKPKLLAAVAEMSDFGWEYKGELYEGKDENFFQPFIDEFYKDTEPTK